MSWQAYVDTQLIATGAVSEALMASAADGSLWAGTPEFLLRAYNTPVTQEDGSEVGTDVNEATDLVSFMTTGVKPAAGFRVNGTKYMVLRSGAEVAEGISFAVYGKHAKTGLCAVKTAQCIIVGTYNEDNGQTGGACNTAVENLARYLIENGF
eukprot:CAMPEP_0182462044 /NCGR_PEP_ID=MMETSP1319-20130603/6441_1 /TAXON_ID=172717 /ORGANISM="Bolidomonas pacifica, Strain RCC208" /LENGTH=152 /DNA_ID=CAMNT_0024661417 /DNA_START=43 /DNA_END=501 /DNA_ORIENTATION=-